MRVKALEALTAFAVAGLVLGALAPSASAHAAPNPLPNEIALLADEGDDAFYYYDGYDLWDLSVREAHWADQDGVIFRFILYGGFAPVPSASALAVEIGLTNDVGEDVVFRMVTTDDTTWEGDLQIVDLNTTEDEPPYPGYTHNFQLFASYDQLGTGPGGAVSNVWMASYADDDMVDIAPGGSFVPHSGGMAEVPHESEGRLVESVAFDGATGYLDVATTVAGDNVTFQITNAFPEDGQHVGVEPGAAFGWTVQSPIVTAASIDGGEDASFTVRFVANETASAPVPVAVHTDLGGLEWFYVGTDNGTLVVSKGAPDVPVLPLSEPNESPGVGVVAVLATMAAAVAITRRRR